MLLANSLTCGNKSCSKYPVFTCVTVFIFEGLRPLSTVFDDWMAPLWVLEKDAIPCKTQNGCVWLPHVNNPVFNHFYLSIPHFKVP